MSDVKPPDFRLPVWLDHGEAARLRLALTGYWHRIYRCVRWPLSQTDPLTCIVPLLELIAWQYDIKRFNGEPLEMFRRRVKLAFINAQDAGSTQGFRQIFRRLKIGEISVSERVPGIDWDVILLTVSAGQISLNPWLLQIIVRQYGRTCRRYRYQVIHNNPVYSGYGFIHGGAYCHSASLIPPVSGFDLTPD